ncbi:MAG: hypothetical protein U0R17_05900 [Acidimicrobiia bacterium]
MEQSKTSFEKLRDFAQYFTAGAAILAGICWVLSDVIAKDSTLFDKLANITIGATMVGGVVMGVLYLIHLTKKEK